MGRIQELFRHVSFLLSGKINRIIGSDQVKSVVEDNLVQTLTYYTVTGKFVCYKGL